MKLPRGKKPVETGGKKLPNAKEMTAIAAQAEYGDDADNPLLWQLLDLKTRLEAKAKGEAEGTTSTVLRRLLQARMGKSGPQWYSEAFTAAVEQAVLTRDAAFFREVARLLETRIGGPHRRIDLEVSRAFKVLQQRAEIEGRELPTKREVREAALFSIAFHDFQHRQNPPLAWKQMHDFNEAGQPRLKPEFAREVRRGIEQFPEQNWTRIFKRCGLAHLPEDSGGRKKGKKS